MRAPTPAPGDRTRDRTTSAALLAADPRRRDGAAPDRPAVRLRDAALRFGDRRLWAGLTLDVGPGEFLAVLGPNGSGKTSLLKVLLGLQTLSAGTVSVCGRTPRRGSSTVGYIPQQKSFDPDLPLRGRDLVRLGLGATAYADAPVGLLSGGEQQRLRIAQALLGDPSVLLCDEPLLSLDLRHQHAVSALIDARRRLAGTAVVFVTHEVNPVLPLVDRVLYLVGGRWAAGTPEEVMTSERLSDLYGTDVDVLRVRGRIVVVGHPDSAHAEHGAHHHHPGDVARHAHPRVTRERDAWG